MQTYTDDVIHPVLSGHRQRKEFFLIGMCEIQSCTDTSHLSDQKYNSDIHDENPVDRLNQSRHTPDGNFGM